LLSYPLPYVIHGLPGVGTTQLISPPVTFVHTREGAAPDASTEPRSCCAP
jgi:hypothetical protein